MIENGGTYRTRITFQINPPPPIPCSFWYKVWILYICSGESEKDRNPVKSILTTPCEWCGHNNWEYTQYRLNEMSRDIVLTSDFMRVRHIMLTADLDRLKVITSRSVCQGGRCKSWFSNVVPWWPYLNLNEARIIYYECRRCLQVDTYSHKVKTF
jgi:hypothetical protein